MEFAASFSGGKDSFLSIKRMIDGGHRLVALIVSSKKESDNLSWVHDIDKKYFENIADLFRCEVIFTNTDVKNYESNFEYALEKVKDIGARACVFGDIDIVNHLQWNNTRCKNAGIECIHPLMFEEREKIVDEFLSTGVYAEVVKVDSKKIPEEFIGSRFDRGFIESIKKLDIENIDLCGENGEYHTRVDISYSDIINIFKDDERYRLGDVYVDNASTCFPKAPGVSSGVGEFLDRNSFSISRGSYLKSYSLSSKIIDIREKVVDFFDGDRKYSCIFSSSATQIINMVLRGYLKKGDEVVVDDQFHNSSLRVFKFLRDNGVEVIVFREKEDYRNLITEKTKMIFLTMVDNVYGHNIFDEVVAKELCSICEEKSIKLVVDVTQAVLERDLSLESIPADALISTSHIGFMGPEGLGILVAKNEFLKEIDPLILGGTGSKSDSEEMPSTIPDRLEAGTMDLPSIFGLNCALNFINHAGKSDIIRKKHRLGSMLRDELKKIKGIDVRGEGSFCLINSEEMDNSELSFLLDQQFSIMPRVGLHCSYQSHLKNNSYPKGGIRMSLGYFNNEKDIKKICDSIKELIIL